MLKVEIAGNVASGKTTLALALAKAATDLDDSIVLIVNPDGDIARVLGDETGYPNVYVTSDLDAALADFDGYDVVITERVE